jgi:predicted nucleic acid-binding protein
MRFVDASVFVHAFIKPRRPLKEHEIRIKESAKRIVRRIYQGEAVCTTVVQVVEISNLLESHLPLAEAMEVADFLLNAENVTVRGVRLQDTMDALSDMGGAGIGLSDAIAYRNMLANGIAEIYSFDRDFDRIEGISRIER